MRGSEVFKNAVLRMTESSRAVLTRTGWTTADVDLVVGHQANVRILHSVADQLGVDRDRAYVDIARTGNTAAASIPLALDHAADEGRLRSGDRVLLTAFGAGTTWGAVTLTWPPGLDRQFTRAA
jgi:3-oxoacyl-[acyl-carrier-protein] synthase-3